MLNSNISIMVPVTGRIKKVLKFDNNKNCNEHAENLTKQMAEACDPIIADTIKREGLGSIKIISYTGDKFDKNTATWIDASISYTRQDSTNLGILSIHIDNLDTEDTVIGDMVYSHQTFLKLDEEYTLGEFLSKLELKQCGMPRIIYINDLKNKTNDNLNYLLVGESAIRENENFGIKTENYIEKEDKSLYDTFEFYASEKGIVIYVKDYNKVRLSEGFNELLFYMMIEVAMLQYAAIYRTILYIKEKLVSKQKGHISSKKALKMIEEFGKTIKLWDNSIWNYNFDQIISDYLVEKFRIGQLKEQLTNLREHIQQVSDLKRNIYSSIESTILNIIAFILGITQIIQIAPQIDNMLKGRIEIQFLMGTIIFFFVIFVIKRNRDEEL